MKITKNSILSEINVTPFIDVMLVLLIIFIITAPMIIPSIDVELPVATSNASNQVKSTEVIITITKDGRIYMQDLQTRLLELKDKIQERVGQEGQAKIFIRGDRDAPYELVVQTIGYLKNSGFGKISLVTDG